jgi:hypothetical protein
MYYRLFLTKQQARPNNNLLIKVIERGRITESGTRSINANPYLLRFFKKRVNRSLA